MLGALADFHIARNIVQMDNKVPLKTVIFMACVTGALAMEVMNLPPRLAFAMVFAAVMTVCPDVWVDLPKSNHDELEDMRREIAALKATKLEIQEEA